MTRNIGLLALLCLASRGSLLGQTAFIPTPLATPLKLPPGNVEVLQIDTTGSYMGDAVRAVDCPNNADEPFGTCGNELFGGAIHLDDDVAAASARLDTLIGDCAGQLDATYVALTQLVDRIRDDDRLHRVEQVMQHSPWSARTTQRVFRRYVGVPVKWVLCRYRLQQAALEIESRSGVDHAELAVRLGWYDQAHFINDFRTLLGTTPGEYAATHGS